MRDTLNEQRAALWATIDAVMESRQVAIDALAQWKHAQDTGDIDELRNARAARDEILRQITA
jgi:hypothetical protein